MRYCFVHCFLIILIEEVAKSGLDSGELGKLAVTSERGGRTAKTSAYGAKSGICEYKILCLYLRVIELRLQMSEQMFQRKQITYFSNMNFSIMKRILYSSFLLIFVLFYSNQAVAQVTQVSVTPQSQCYNATGIYTINAGIFQPVVTAVTYSWNIAGPYTPVSYTNGQHPVPTPVSSGSQVAITATACGIYTLTIFPFAFSGPTPILIPGGVASTTFEIICASSGSVAISNTAICLGNNVVFSGSGGAAPASYTWNINGNTQTGNPIILTPTVNTCVTYTATSPQGCTLTPTAQGCVSVQAISGTVSPASQTICANSPICLNVTGQVTSGSNVLPGTVITNTAWLAPGGLAIASSCTTNATAGTYSAVLTHTGAAGSCSVIATSSVVTSNSISVLASASAPSVCPNATVQLSATSIQTAATQYTWTIPSFPFNITQIGLPITRTNNIATLTNPMVYTVNTSYFGCPGSATVAVGYLTITPTLTPSSFSICAGTQLTLSASGGSLYTFRYWNNSITPASNTIIGTGNSSTFSRVATPSLSIPFPHYYSVSTTSNGCSGSTTITVSERTLFPTIIPSSASVCPGTQFTLSAGNVGTGSFTFASSYSANIGSPTSSVAHVPPTLNPIPQSYTLTADSAGCRGTATITINRLTLPTTIAASSQSICAGTGISFTVSGGMDTKDTLFGPPGTPPGVLATAIAGTVKAVFNFTPVTTPLLPHVYTVNADSAGCKGVATITIGLLNLGPKINVSPSTASVCPNRQFTLNASTPSGSSTFTYNFYGPGGSQLSTTTPTAVTQSSILPVTYTVTADSSSCSGFTTITIFRKVLNPVLVSSQTLVCANSLSPALTITATNVGYSTSNSYTFGTLSPVTGSLATGNFSFITHSPSVQTVYTVLVDSAGCTNNLLSPPSLTVFMRPDLALTPAASAASVCPGTSATIAVTSPAYVTWPVTYTWSQTTGSGSITPPVISPSLVVYPFSNSVYSVTAKDSLGCVGHTVISIGIDPTISFSLALSSSGSTICAGQSMTLSATSTISTFGTPPVTYSWVPSTGTVAALGNIIVSPSITTIYTVIAANQYGCVAGRTITVPVGTYPSTVNAVLATATAVCTGFTSTLTAFNANTYMWTGTTFTNSISQQSISVGPGVYTVVLSNGGTCTSTVTIPINTLQPIPINISTSTNTTCIESNFPKFSKAVKLNASGAASYVWSPYNPLNMTYSLGPNTDVRPSATTIYTVVGSTAICANSKTISITVIPQFTMNVVPPLPAICIGDSLKLIIANISTLAVGPVSAFTYSWSDPGSAPPISLSNNLSPTVVAFPQNTSTYSVEVKDSRQCISLPRLVTLTVLPRPLTSIAVPTINSVATNSICYVGLNPGAKDVTIDLLGVNQNQGLQFGVVPTYTWLQPYKAQYNSILTPSNSAGVTVSAPVKLPSVVVYTLISGYNGIAGCKRIDTVSVRVVDCRPVRNVIFTTTEINDTICARNCITFQNLTDTMAGGPQKLNWQFPGGSPATSTLQIPTICYNLPGKYNVILGVSNPYPISSGGSSLTIGQLGFVKVVDVPNVTIIDPGQERSDTTVRFGTAVRLSGKGALTYEWSPNYNITSLTNPNVTVNPFKTTQYILNGYNSKRCTSSDTINVIVIADCGEMYVPNAFTPNNDGANDVLYVRGICLESLTFMVFNRWGEKVFETTDQRVGWDGSYKGEDLNTGVFVYRLEGKTYDGVGFSLKGNVTLIR